MLRFIIGTNENARRKELYKHIGEEKSSYLIVPEQFSFESEKLLDEFLGPEKARNVEVLSFSRLCNSIFRAFGGIAGEYTDDTAKLLLMGAALSACGENLSYYKKNIHGAPFIKKLVQADSEMKNAGLSPDDLLRFAEKGGTLGEKAADLSTVFELYNSMLEKSYIDPLTDIKRACEILSENDFFSEKAVFLDNFTGFTGSEYKMLRAILEQSPLVEISLCCDGIFDRTGGTGLFSKTQRTAGKLEKIAKECGAAVKTPIFAEDENDERPEAIIDLEENFLCGNSPKGTNGGEIRLVSCRDPYDEAAFAAVMARSLAENHGYRWRDMAIIARDLSPYDHALPAAFKRAGIPLHMDKNADLSAHPLSAFISASLSSCRSNFAFAEVMRIIKTGILPLSEEEIAEFENYCFIWNIRGRLFTEPFSGNPEGFREFTPEDNEKLERINALREKIITPLEKLRKKISGANGKEFSAAFYEYLCECEVTEGLRRLYDELYAIGETAAAENLDSFWSFTIEALDKISAALGEVCLEGDTIGRLFEAVLAEANIEILDTSALYHIYVSEAVEPEIAYATVSADAALLDMPFGDAVATLKAGASLYILGSIGIDGEEFSFVSVPGTEFKGFVNVADMTAVEEETALAADNAALTQAAQLAAKNPIFTIAMNDGSLIFGELYPEVAPETVGNFVSLANQGFYNGLIFHRVIPGFMIQGGDPNGNGTGGPGYSIKGEFANNGVENNISHVRGAISMARAAYSMDSADSQFFIMHADGEHLDGDYAAFGMVLGGIETVDLIASVQTDNNDKPRTEQAMREVFVQTYGQTYEFTKLED